MAVARAFVVALALGFLVVPLARAQTAPAAPPAGATPPGAPAPSGSAAPAPKPPGVTGGYSWSDKKARKGRARPHARRRLKFDPAAPIATFPGFRMLPDGRSLVFVSVSKVVGVEVRRSGNRVAYVLSGADVAVRNNTNALVTTWFDTPLSRARLQPAKGGAQLVLELREAADPTYRVNKLANGWMTLEVVLPAPAAPGAAGDAAASPTAIPAKKR